MLFEHVLSFPTWQQCLVRHPSVCLWAHNAQNRCHLQFCTLLSPAFCLFLFLGLSLQSLFSWCCPWTHLAGGYKEFTMHTRDLQQDLVLTYNHGPRQSETGVRVGLQILIASHTSGGDRAGMGVKGVGPIKHIAPLLCSLFGDDHKKKKKNLCMLSVGPTANFFFLFLNPFPHYSSV